MAIGRVVVAHHSESVRRAIVDGLTARGVICAVARQAAEVVLMQAAMRADAVFMDSRWTLEAGGRNMLAALQRDVTHPYVLVCGSRISRGDERQMHRMGACSVVCEEETGRILEMIERNLTCRGRMEENGDSALCSVLNRLFSDYGLPCHLSRCFLHQPQLQPARLRLCTCRSRRRVAFPHRLCANGKGLLR